MTKDISKFTFNSKNHYSQVDKLQGRTTLDSESNEQGRINRHWDKTANQDIIGECGFPRDNAGFEITVFTEDNETLNLNISSGNGYIHGILCENEETILFTEQSDFLEAILPEENGIYLAYLDVWERTITALQALSILEAALNGVDTTSREKIMCQVKLLPGFAVDFTPFLTFLSEIQNRLEEELSDSSGGLDNISSNIPVAIQNLRDRIQTFRDNFSNFSVESRLGELRNLLTDIRNLLPNLNINDQNLINAIDTALADLNSPSATESCEMESQAWDDLIVSSTGTLNARTQPEVAEDNPCLIPASAGYQCLGNQLYRVEIHNVNSDGIITFKLSRENGSVATAIEEISGNTITVNSLGRDENLGFAIGQWVEIIDDRLDQTYHRGQLVQIQDINPDTREIIINPQTFRLFASQNGGSEDDSLPILFPNGLNLDYHPILRRWEQQGNQATEAGVAVAFNEWINLECGIQIQFSEGTYHQGDYWLIPARAAIGDIEWPRDENGNPIPQSSEGIEHHYCRLALVQIEGSEITVLSDCRQIFAPLAESPVTNAMHVTDISWNHADYLHVSLLEQPLEITLDDTPLSSTLTPQTIEVSSRTPFGGIEQSITPDVIFISDGEISVENRIIRWQFSELQRIALEDQLTPNPNDNPSPPFSIPFFLIMRGYHIRNALGLHIDGQVFGQEPDATGQRIRLPSGDNQRASTFESWFYITRTDISSIKITPSPVRGEQTATGVITLTSSAPNGGVEVRLSSSNPRVASVPSIVTIPVGSREASFLITTSNSFSRTTVNITAVFAGIPVQQPLIVEGRGFRI